MMSKKKDDFLKKLLSTFKVEADEHLKSISSGLIELEKKPDAEKQIGIIETIYREVHSLKGASRAVNMTDIGEICQSLESVFAALKHREITLSPIILDTLHHTHGTISQLISIPEGGEVPQVSELIQQLEYLKTGKGEGLPRPCDSAQESLLDKSDTRPEDIAPQPQKDIMPPVHTETVRISTAKLVSILLQAEELLSTKLAVSQHADDLRDIIAMLGLWTKEWAKFRIVDFGMQNKELKNQQSKIPGPDRRADRTPAKTKSLLGQARAGHNPKLKEFLDWNHTRIKLLENKLKALAKTADSDHRLAGGMIDNLLMDVKKVMMFPFSSLLEIFPKMVRDISRDQDKEADLTLKGGNVEIDRRILEEMKDPLIHLLRNGIDHGIEKPEERIRRKKPPRGTIMVTISQVSGGKVEIIVKDDGAGIDLDKVKDVAVKNGVVSEEEAEKLNERESLSLIFQSEVSTSPIITDISGRGLGLAIVREKVEKLGGFVSAETTPHKGTTFQIILPLTIATFRGILVQTGDHAFVMPTVNVEHVARIKQDEIKTVENKETISFNGYVVSFVRLNEVLGLPHRGKREQGENRGSEYIPVLFLRAMGERIAFSVDDILGEQEVLLKGIGKQLSRVRNIASAAVLGSGRVVSVLNVHDLMKTAVKVPARLTGMPAGTAAEAKEVEARRKSILIAEDSITSRMLLKNILESAGYHVKTTIDGVDAFTSLREEDYDLVVSDIDMPRMNGFDLTSKIRDDKKLTEMPVVLVTALESQENRERGIDVGANAYIVKSSFDQSNLLEIIRRLI